MTKNRIHETSFWHFFQPVIDALNDLGGSGQPTEVKDLIAEKMKLSEEEQNK